MIQDIFPYRLDHAFRDREPEPEDCFFLLPWRRGAAAGIGGRQPEDSGIP